MKFTLNWLKRHLDTGASLQEIKTEAINKIIDNRVNMYFKFIDI